MRHASRRLGWVALAAVAVVGLLALAGCQKDHPDVKQAVYNTLNQNELSSVEIFQDRRAGKITLRGIVGSPDRKTRAENLVQQAAPGYTIDDQLKVESAGLESMENSTQKAATLDSTIEDKFKASIQSNKKLDKENIRYSADKGTLYLKGSVKSEREKREAEELAKKVPQVQHVVNDIAVKPS